MYYSFLLLVAFVLVHDVLAQGPNWRLTTSTAVSCTTAFGKRSTTRVPTSRTTFRRTLRPTTTKITSAIGGNVQFRTSVVTVPTVTATTTTLNTRTEWTTDVASDSTTLFSQCLPDLLHPASCLPCFYHIQPSRTSSAIFLALSETDQSAQTVTNFEVTPETISTGSTTTSTASGLSVPIISGFRNIVDTAETSNKKRAVEQPRGTSTPHRYDVRQTREYPRWVECKHTLLDSYAFCTLIVR